MYHVSPSGGGHKYLLSKDRTGEVSDPSESSPAQPIKDGPAFHDHQSQLAAPIKDLRNADRKRLLQISSVRILYWSHLTHDILDHSCWTFAWSTSEVVATKLLCLTTKGRLSGHTDMLTLNGDPRRSKVGSFERGRRTVQSIFIEWMWSGYRRVVNQTHIHVAEGRRDPTRCHAGRSVTLSVTASPILVRSELTLSITSRLSRLLQLVSGCASQVNLLQGQRYVLRTRLVEQPSRHGLFTLLCCLRLLRRSAADHLSPHTMRRPTPIANLLHNHLFPNANTADPPTFSAHLARNLVPEVRIEVSQFYGDLNSAEARYPGLNYAYRPHRLRLGRFKHHRRLFEAFDDLGLTYGEIQEFCCWEGTKWARERYEKDEGITVHDTTANEIGPYVDRREMKVEDERRRHSITRKTSISVIVEPATQQIIEENDEEMSDGETEVEDGARTHEHEDNSSGTETPSEAAARQLHISALDTRRDHVVQRRRLLAALQQGHALSPEMEQYLKEQSERGDIDLGVGDLRALVNSIRATDRAPVSTATSTSIASRAVA
nr:hypothetical protein CFP56_57844 [Quercus suber]